MATYQQRLGPPLTPDQVGKAIVGLAADSGQDQPAYMLTAGGLAQVPA